MVQTLTRQTLHYLARPHSAPPTGPLAGPAAWKAADMADGAWREVLTSIEIVELEAAIDHSAHLPLTMMSAADFPLPRLAGKLARWREALSHGRGFQVIRGLPVERCGEERSARCFWGLGQHLGLPGVQDPQGNLLGHVRDEQLQSADVRSYRTSAAISYHCDAADVVGLLCMRSAPTGGLSRLVSSVSVFNELRAEAPHLAARMFRPMWLDTRGDSALSAVPVIPCRYYGGRLRTFYHTDYFRSATRHAVVPVLSDLDREAMDAYERIANTPGMYLDMRLQAGDIQLVSNHTILHARTAYAPGSRRHLLRLWLSLPGPTDSAERLATRLANLDNLRRLAAQGIRERLYGLFSPFMPQPTPRLTEGH